jgi:phosphotriesterase-related protein
LLAGKIWTVTGPIEPNNAGITLAHEHLLIDMSGYAKVPEEISERKLAHSPITMNLLGWIKAYSVRHVDNMRLLDEDTAEEEAMQFKNEGGRTIVEVTPKALGRDAFALKRISIKTGLNIVAGCGYYVDAYHPSDMNDRSVERIKEDIVREIAQGIPNTRLSPPYLDEAKVAREPNSGIRTGIIGEIGNSYPWTENEKKVCRAAARAQMETGAPITIHPGRHHDASMEIIRLLKNEGADLTRIIMSHIDKRVSDIASIRAIADQGCYLEYDGFGTEHYFPFASFDMPSDAERINQIRTLIKEGYVRHILISHDICQKISLTKYGGYGYAHISRNIVPRMIMKGISEDEIKRMIVENPRSVLTFAEA